MILSLLLYYVLPFIAGIGSGVSVSLASGTASPIIIPLLTLVYNVPIYEAISTSLFIDTLIGVSAGALYLLKKQVDLQIIPLIGIPGALGVLIGSSATTSTSETQLSLIIAFILLIIGLNFTINGIQKNIELIHKRFRFTFLVNHKNVFLLTFGFFAGILSGFLGIGIGAIIALVLIFIYEYELHKAIGTSLLIMAVIAGMGTILHALESGIALEYGMIGGMGAVLGGCIGSFFANRINGNILGRIIGVIILIFGMLLIVQVFW